MNKITGQSLVKHIQDQFTEFSDGTQSRVFLWEPRNGYPDPEGTLVPLDKVERPFCLVQPSGSDSAAATLRSQQPFTKDAQNVSIHVFCKSPEDDPYQFETLPASLRRHLAGQAVSFLDYDQSPPVLVDTIAAERVTQTSAEGKGVCDPLYLYRATLRMQFVFYNN